MEALYTITFASALTALYHLMKLKFTWWKLKVVKPVSKIRSENERIRQSPEYYQWRQAVLKRDQFRCVWCRATGYLEVDHVYPFAYFPELRFDVMNGRTLCRPCHEKTPTYKSKAKVFYQALTNSK